LRILFCNYEYPPLGGGGGVVMAAMARSLAERHDVTVLTSQAVDLPFEGKDANVKVVRVPVFFRKAKFRPQEKEVNDLKEPPDKRLVSFIEEASQSDHQALRENALWAMAFYLP